MCHGVDTARGAMSAVAVPRHRGRSPAKLFWRAARWCEIAPACARRGWQAPAVRSRRDRGRAEVTRQRRCERTTPAGAVRVRDPCAFRWNSTVVRNKEFLRDNAVFVEGCRRADHAGSGGVMTLPQGVRGGARDGPAHHGAFGMRSRRSRGLLGRRRRANLRLWVIAHSHIGHHAECGSPTLTQITSRHRFPTS
jgi:hypothetical protein